jgi:hypothetical protein
MSRISISPRKRSWVAAGLVVGLGLVVEEFADALGRSEGALELRDELGELHEGRGEHAGETGELGELILSDGPVGEHAHRNQVTRMRATLKAKMMKAMKEARGDRGTDDGAEILAEILSVTGHFEGLVAEGLHADDALEAFLHDDLRGARLSWARRVSLRMRAPKIAIMTMTTGMVPIITSESFTDIWRMRMRQSSSITV